MLTGFALLAVGAALLGYVVLARRPSAPSARPRSLAPRPRTSRPPPIDTEDGSEAAVTQIMRVRSPLRSAVLESLTDDRISDLTAPRSTKQAARPTATKVVVAYEEAADEEESTSPLARILVTASGDTDQGLRRNANDDSMLVLPDHCLFAVADGMGGYAGGAEASALAVEAMKRAFEEESFASEWRSASQVPRRGGELVSSMMQAHEEVAKAARANPKHAQMGTTLVAARFSPNKQRVYIGHVGDSRCYRFRRGSLRQLTTDQTMSKVGLVGPHADDLLQAIGVSKDLFIDLIVDKPESGDIYLLCSDGLNKMVGDRQIQRVLATQRDLEAAVYGLIELANDAGGRDNVTVILIKVLDRTLHDIATIPSPPPEMPGSTKALQVAAGETGDDQDATVVARLPSEPSRLSFDPATSKPRR